MTEHPHGATADSPREARALWALLDLAKALGSQVDLEPLLSVIVEMASNVVEAERTSLYVVDDARDILWTRVAQGLGSVRIELPLGSGVAGDVARSRRIANVGDAAADPRFDARWDAISGFRTRSLLAAPITNSAGRLLGVVQSMNKLGAERFDENDELLMTAIASHVGVAMERAMLTETAIENERLSEALKLAFDIQMRMLPPGTVKPVPGAPFDLHAYIRPAKMVGGDLYDYAVTADGRLYFCLGDVSGKGIGAALVMALTKTLFRANVPYFEDVSKLMEAVNVRLCEDTGPTMFVTAFCGFLDLEDGTLRFCNAGHDRPFQLRRGAPVELLQSKPGIALGVVPKFQYPLQQIQLSPGDALFLYTDGVTEAANAADELFGLERLRDALPANFDDATQAIATVTSAVDAFAGPAPQADDLTMLCVRYKG
jgi:serine phosphatase RsbU (regulator of sigma subunit)